MQCKLFDSLVKPILSYASEVCAVDLKAGASAEKLQNQFFRQLLRVRNSTTNEMVLAELADIHCRLTSGNKSCAFTTELSKCQTLLSSGEACNG